MVGYQGWIITSIKAITKEHTFQLANSAVMGLLHFSVLAVLIVRGRKSDLCVLLIFRSHKYLVAGLGKSVPAGTHQLTNNNSLI